MFAQEGPFLLDVHVREESMVFPMIPPGSSVDEIMLNNEDWFNYGD
jgi:thiamine pyrophosphate-dependent acetolactate synthase large subunit-like protein